MNELEIRVWAMKRSGQHAIIDWITKHTDGPILHVNNPLREQDCRFYHNMSRGKDGQNNKWLPKKLYLFNVEDALLSQHVSLVNQNKPIRQWKTKGQVVDAPLLKKGPSKRVVDALIVRDPANLWASRIRVCDKLKQSPNQWYERRAQKMYRQYLAEAVGATNYLTNEKTVIDFGRWTESESYRKDLGSKLGLTGPYEERNSKVSQFGGGSSFGREGKIATVNERWKLMKGNKRLRQALKHSWAWPETQKLYGDNAYVIEAVKTLLP